MRTTACDSWPDLRQLEAYLTLSNLSSTNSLLSESLIFIFVVSMFVSRSPRRVWKQVYSSQFGLFAPAPFLFTWGGGFQSESSIHQPMLAFNESGNAMTLISKCWVSFISLWHWWNIMEISVMKIRPQKRFHTGESFDGETPRFCDFLPGAVVPFHRIAYVTNYN